MLSACLAFFDPRGFPRDNRGKSVSRNARLRIENRAENGRAFSSSFQLYTGQKERCFWAVKAPLLSGHLSPKLSSFFDLLHGHSLEAGKDRDSLS